MSGYAVDVERCIRCGSCAILAPALFEVTRRVRLVRQPETATEHAAAGVATIVCPTRAISASTSISTPPIFGTAIDPATTSGTTSAAASIPPTPTQPTASGTSTPTAAGSPPVPVTPTIASSTTVGADLVAEMLHTPLFAQAEAVRWKMADIPWSKIDAERAPLPLRELVRQIAYSELTTFSATRRFLTELADDVDFTQWISVWFYEESKHPQALLQWLHHVGVGVDAQFVLKGRATAPFMKSRMGTLVTNIISEMVASTAYTRLWQSSPEPVLALIARNLAGDESRHAASFYAYAQRLLERSKDPDADRRDALKVLYMWFSGNELVAHPVNEFFTRNEIDFDVRAPRDRITRLVGSLVGVTIDETSNLLDTLRQLGGAEAVRGRNA